jgi:hypothetical protein
MKTKITLLASLMLVSYASIAQWATSGNNIYNTNSGNVGIGTSTPSVKLEVNGGGATDVLNLLNESSSLGLNATISSNTSFHAPAFIGNRSRGSLNSKSNVSSGDRISGIYGSMYVNGAFRTSAAIQFYAGTSPSSTSYPSTIRFETTANASTTRTERMRITESGNVGIGSTSPSYLLDVNGTVRAASYLTSSDARLKTNVKRIENVLNKISLVEGYTFGYNSEKFKDKQFPGGNRYGFIAQNVQKSFPELVSTDGEGYLAVDYVAMVPILLEAINKLKSKFDALAEQYVMNLVQDEEKNSISQKTFLEQNFPNPSKGMSTISYSLPDEISMAKIVVYTLDGFPIKEYQIQNHQVGKVEIQTSELQPGVYLYSLVVNGGAIKTKRLIISK